MRAPGSLMSKSKKVFALLLPSQRRRREFGAQTIRDERVLHGFASANGNDDGFAVGENDRAFAERAYVVQVDDERAAGLDETLVFAELVERQKLSNES